MSASNTYWDLWLDEALQGRIAIPELCMGVEGDLLMETLNAIRRRGEVDRIDLYVHCKGGDRTCWRVARLLDALQAGGVRITASIGYAISAGLIIAMAAGERVCRPRARFLWHGSQSKPKFDESGKSDDERAQYMADRTIRDFDWWMEKAISGQNYEFGAEEAVHIGVCHKIMERGEMI